MCKLWQWGKFSILLQKILYSFCHVLHLEESDQTKKWLLMSSLCCSCLNPTHFLFMTEFRNVYTYFCMMNCFPLYNPFNIGKKKLTCYDSIAIFDDRCSNDLHLLFPPVQNFATYTCYVTVDAFVILFGFQL